jgi:hypothetical protein
VSWDWTEKYLPDDIHVNMKTFESVLALLGKSECADRDQGGLIVLGFGLLLRECRRAMEVKGDDETAPTFLQESLLNSKRVDQVIKGIEEVIDRLPSLQKELEGCTKGTNNPLGEKKLTTIMSCSYPFSRSIC